MEEDQLEVAETVVLLTEMLRAIGAELRQQKEKTAKLARLEAMQAAVEVDGSEAVVLEAE